jgi:hypothetical protein
MMTRKFSAATRLAALLAAVSLVGFGISAANAAPKARYDEQGRITYGPNGPNASYQQGPRTRVYITKRSWLDAGVEVLPGDRKFNDYAYPPGYSFARDNNNRPLDRQPLNSQWDLGGYPERIPLPPY